jgi:hypothetical protein
MKELAIAIKTVYDALDQIGIHPAAVTTSYGTPEEKTVERVTWKDGWNACVMEHIDIISKALENLQTNYDENFAILSITDLGWYEPEQDVILLNMSDTFHYACADCEPVTHEEAKEVVRLFEKHGVKGVDYWVAEKRGYDPKIPKYCDRVQAVRMLERGTL